MWHLGEYYDDDFFCMSDRGDPAFTFCLICWGGILGIALLDTYLRCVYDVWIGSR